MSKPELKEKAINLRKQGLTYNEILERVSAAKSTLSYWLSDLKIPKEAKERLERRREEVRENFIENYAGRTRDELSPKTIRKMEESGRRIQEKYGEKLRRFSAEDAHKASLLYRQDELPIKAQLESILEGEFTKEEIDGYYIDFTNNKFLIEHTRDNTKGLSEAIDRLNSVHDDRKKILITYIDKIGPKRLSRCANIELLDIRAFRQGLWLPYLAVG